MKNARSRHWKSIILFCFVVVLSRVGRYAAGQEVDAPVISTAPKVETVYLTRSDCFSLALENNLDIKISEIGPQKTDGDVLAARGEFDPNLQMDIRRNEGDNPQSSQFQRFGSPSQVISKVMDFRSTLGGKIPTGANYSLLFQLTRTKNTFNKFVSEFDGTSNLTVTQPLLKGMGFGVNLTNIRVARIGKEISGLQLRQKVMDIIGQVEKAYWDLVFTINDLEVKRQSVKTAEELLRQNNIRVEVGTAAPIEVYQAEAGLARRQSDVIAAEKLVHDAEDNLLRTLNMREGSALWSVSIVPLDQPTELDVTASEEESITMAYEKRPEIHQASLQVKTRDLQARQKRNQLLPAADLRGIYGFNSLREDARDAVFDMKESRYVTWEVGFAVSVPLGNNVAQGQYLRANFETQEATYSLANLKLAVVQEVREAVRRIGTSQQLIESNRKTKTLQEKVLEAEERKLEVGASTSHQVLEFEDELAQAQSAELQAIVSYLKAVTDLDRSAGTILEKRKVELAEES